MKRITTLLLAILMLASMSWAKEDLRVIKSKKSDLSPRLTDMVREANSAKAGKFFEREIKNNLPSERFRDIRGEDPVRQRDMGPIQAGPTSQNFEGSSNFDNQAVVGGRIAPPDPNMDVGSNHVIQSINLISQIWDKSGNSLLGPFATNDFWNGFGGDCEFENDGDPTVNYDEVNDRWIVAQFVFSQSQCYAVSQTGDALGAYYRYEFNTPGNDYPKTSVMNDAYYGTIRTFTNPFSMDAYAVDAAAMRAGNPATLIVRSMSTSLPNIDGFLSSDLEGGGGPSAGATFMGFQSSPPRLAIFEMTPDFGTPSNTTFTGPTFLTVPPIDRSVGGIAQPAPGGNLDGLTGFMMYRLAMRDMGSYNAMVACHTVDAGGNQAGVRWYELRNSGGGWSVFQQGTYAPNDGVDRWMGSIAMNQNGDIGLGYSAVSSSLFPSIRYTGRLANDPLGQMTRAEGIIVSGSGSQLNASRWGDYSSIQVDPSNGETFWYTTEYVQTTGSFNWWTRIGAFDIDSAPANLVVTITPTNPPVTITSPGSFDYTLRVENIGSANGATVNAQVWTFARRSTGGATDPLFGPINVSLAPGDVYETSNTQNVPGIDPASFDYIGAVGGLPGNIMSSGDFPFTVLGPVTLKGASGELGPWAAVAGDAGELLPDAISLNQNYPNPFNPTTKISYDLKASTHVKLSVYNTLGQKVKTLVNGNQVGSQEVTWNATNEAGQKVAAGIYMYRLEAGDFVKTMKMTLTK